MNLAPALEIQGWMSEPELFWLAEQANKHKNIVEVGCFRGRSTRALADNTDGIIHAIDPWDGAKQYYSPESQDEAKLTYVFQNGTGEIYGEFYCNLADYIKSGKVKVYRNIFTNVYIKNPDMVFIDAIHEYQAVKNDTFHALMLLNGKGLICGHDYCSSWPEVIRAVDEIFGHVEVCDSIWYYNL